MMLSTDRDFAAFLVGLTLEHVIWEGYASATHLQKKLWKTKLGTAQQKKAS